MIDRTKHVATIRIDAIRILRFIAITLVIFGHAIPNAVKYGHGYPGMLKTRLLGGIGVDIFFIVSGLVMILAHMKDFGRAGFVKHFVLRRAARIMPMYTIFNLVYLLLDMIHRGIEIGCKKDSVVYLASSVAFFAYRRCDGQMLPLVSQGWTLNLEMFFYICFAAGILFKKEYGVLLTLVMLSTPTLWLTISPDSQGRLWDTVNFYAKPVRILFVFGMSVSLLVPHRARFRINASPLLVGTAVLIFLISAEYVFRSLSGAYPYFFVSGTATVTVLLSLIAVGTEKGRLLSASLLIGDASYSIYLCHNLVLTMVKMVWSNLNLWSHPIIYVMASTTAAISAGLLIYQFVERPTTRLAIRGLRK